MYLSIEPPMLCRLTPSRKTQHSIECKIGISARLTPSLIVSSIWHLMFLSQTVIRRQEPRDILDEIVTQQSRRQQLPVLDGPRYALTVRPPVR